MTFTYSGDNTARLIEVSSGQEIARIPHQGRGEAMTFSPDSKYLATRGADGTARLIEVSSGQEITRITHRFSVIAVVFSPDGKYLATGSADNTARLIEVKTGKEIARISHQDGVKAVTFSPDSKYLATGSEDNTARLIEVTSRKEISGITHQDTVEAVEFSPDSKYLVTRSRDNTVQLHFLNSQALMIEACRRLKRNLRVDEWQNYINVQLHLYDKTCKNYPIHPSFLKEGERLAKEGKVIDAIATYKKAQKLDSNLQEPKPKISAESWNSLCRFGSLHKHAAEVMFACEKAVTLAPKDGEIRDSRGLARALTGKTKGAIQDFQAFREWTKNGWQKEQRQKWIDALQAGKNPFTEEEIESLF